jgi:hypothetical protein
MDILGLKIDSQDIYNAKKNTQNKVRLRPVAKTVDPFHNQPKQLQLLLKWPPDYKYWPAKFDA